MDKDRFIEILVNNLDGCIESDGIWFLTEDWGEELEKLLIEYRGFVYKGQQ